MSYSRNQERENQLKSMFVMQGLDDQLDCLEGSIESSGNSIATTQSMSSNLNVSPLGEENSENPTGITVSKREVPTSPQDVADLFMNLLSQFDALADKLQSIQTAHFELQHSCCSATEVAQVALKDFQRGNPYLAKIDTILTRQNSQDITESIIVAANEMVSVAREDTEMFIQAIQSYTQYSDTMKSEQHESETGSTHASPLALIFDSVFHQLVRPQVPLAA